ncbi:ATP-binding protein [Streptomyces sp. NPDC096193]|uniref:ATP-binding protein n=1 Tax=Streptomyces sp. NPDC096193 TaxID=3155821 RepID=UPI00331BA373
MAATRARTRRACRHCLNGKPTSNSGPSDSHPASSGPADSPCAFDFDANPNIDPATVHTLASCEWIKKSQPLCRIGDSGTGKSHMLIALGTEAAMKSYRVRYTLATKLVNELVEAADEKQLNKTIARYGRVDLLCIDELGYMELDRHGAELLFQVLTERHVHHRKGSPRRPGGRHYLPLYAVITHLHDVRASVAHKPTRALDVASSSTSAFDLAMRKPHPDFVSGQSQPREPESPGPHSERFQCGH